MFDRGFLKLGTWRGVPVRLHWTAPLGAALFGGLRWAPAVWVSFFVLVIVHELGHAYLVRRYGHHVMAIDVTGFGGLCRWFGTATTFERAAIAWGGVVAQAALLVIALVLSAVFGPFYVGVGRDLVGTFIYANFWLIILNLLPFPPFDGKEAWPLARLLFQRWRNDGKGVPASIPPPASRRGTSVPHAAVPSTEPSAPLADTNEFADFLRRVAEAAGEARGDSPRARPRPR
ncbi:MAG TPA: hypothetical protein VI072_17550 [Polyangiaceae bacterium]